MSEKQNKFLTKLLMIEKNKEPTIIYSIISTPYIEQVPVFSFGNKRQYRKEKPTISSDSSLITEIINMPKLKSHTKLQPKYKESTCLTQDIVSSWFST